MNDLVDLTFPPISKQSEPAFTDFNYWRPPIATVEIPQIISPPSPALSARSDSSSVGRLSLLNKVLPRRNSRTSMLISNDSGNITASSSRPGSVSRPISPPPTVVDELEGEGEGEGEDEDVQGQQERMHDYGDELSGSLPGSFELDGKMDRYSREARHRNMAARRLDGGAKHGGGEEQGEEEEEEVLEDEEAAGGGAGAVDDEEDYLPEMDFSSVPVRPFGVVCRRARLYSRRRLGYYYSTYDGVSLFSLSLMVRPHAYARCIDEVAASAQLYNEVQLPLSLPFPHRFFRASPLHSSMMNGTTSLHEVKSCPPEPGSIISQTVSTISLRRLGQSRRARQYRGCPVQLQRAF
jgi:hypothetical protein